MENPEKMKLNLRFIGIYVHLLVRQRKKEEDGRGRTRRRGSEADGQDQKSSWFGGSVNHLMMMIGGSVLFDDDE